MTSRNIDHHRKRSRSPDRYYARSDEVKRPRSRSPHRKHHRDHHRSTTSRSESVKLPFKAELLHKHDFKQYEGLFARYLDVQKQIDINELSETEVRGRWKSFLGKWNRGELAEGWYDPEARWRAEDRWKNRPTVNERDRAELVTQMDAPIHPRPLQVGVSGVEDAQEDSDEDGFGPALPDRECRTLGASIPSLQDLQHREELISEAHQNSRTDLQYSRKVDRNLQKDRLEELAPRADPGSRERQLEKKADKTSTLHAFREAKDGGDVEVNDQEMMGGGEDEFKKELKRREKVKSEREVRKEEALRARMAEREERMQGVRAKEEKTMDMLRSLARERFG
ncbi:hypothetical protein CKM354_000915900 [Cercospora kikuchii]|uniref:RNA helicase HEL117 n=1 Tax=Cercospora kikuchii TaxID=84275 RepID=A0A9P3CNU0_9PEZI|nr:uncharacterized protein CKM354_000915900 [Cercospora kikuchii]GIZ46016.1 hypothetical protein CKM354_000915900 [Cercospora kikuchii]